MAALADPSDLESYLSGDEQVILGQVSAAVQNYCGWHIAPAVDETIHVDGAGGNRLRLPTLHINTVGDVLNDGTLIPSDQVFWSTAGWLEIERGRWSTRPRGVTVTLNHGWPEVPADVVGVIVSVAARAKSSPSGATREQAGSVSFTWSATAPGVAGGIGLLDHERSILDRYRLSATA